MARNNELKLIEQLAQAHAARQNASNLGASLLECVVAQVELKQCNTCRRVKAISEFHRYKRRKDSLRGICKECAAAYKRAYRETHSEKIAAQWRVYREENHEKIAAYQQTYYTEHREEIIAKVLAWRKHNPEKINTNRQKRRARIAGATVGPIDYDAIWLRDGGRCCICSLKVDNRLEWPDPMSLSWDHTIPLSLGGPHTQNNLRVCHLRCNSRRGVGRLPAQIVLV